ncbi:assimilatory nitrate reductase catalytic subunit [Advenella incenata]|uniref:Assimilatory nitrate reductase catalytic subunit n=1 Tax=Advenella incenata TaxID=267800 RepID=A0A4Q7VSX1_9BURK|nr:nitrate reductase [Advenella incenata]RZT99387.1 assimilatory nitrate reductase catalytic subunit [Advenella incenata]
MDTPVPVQLVQTMTDEIRVTRSICCYCGTGCGVRIHSKGEQVLSVDGDMDHPSNAGLLCSKGMALPGTIRRDTTRVLHARLRDRQTGNYRQIDMSEAFDVAARVISSTVREAGPQAMGFYLSGQLLTEDYAIFNKMARVLVGTNNIDTNSRLCMSSAVTGYKMTLGADAPPASYEDIALADTVLIAGSNMAYAHPVLFRRLMLARQARPHMKIIVIDPRNTDTAQAADLHLAVTPGADVALFHAMLNVMVWEDLIDGDYIARYTEGFPALKDRIREFTPAAAEDVCGVAAADIVTAARWFAQSAATLSLYTMGLNQSSSGTAKNMSLIHLHLATGHIGRPGTGPFSLTGQPNAMGGREAGAMATLLPGHRDPANARHRQEVAALWGTDSLPEAPGYPAIAMFDALLEKRIRVLWIAATNPAQSLPDQARVRRAMQNADFVIVQEAYADSETLAYADLILPAATWPEKEGTVTNSERRISRVRAAISAPGDALADWKIVQQVAQRVARLIAPAKEALFNYADEAQIFAEHAALTAGRDLDYSAVSFDLLEQLGPVQWPFVQTGTPRLYTDHVFATANGRARFADVGYVAPVENISAHYPLRLTTGRLRDHWHTMTRTALSQTLIGHVEEPVIHLHPSDMARYRIGSQALVTVKSRRAQLVLPAQADDTLKPGCAFVPMHWGSRFMAGVGINGLTHGATDPDSGQPELKHCVVGVALYKPLWQAVAWVRGDAVALQRTLSGWLNEFDYAIAVPVATGDGGLRLRLAARAVPERARLEQLLMDLGIADTDVAFDDPARGIYRRVRCIDGRVAVYCLAGTGLNAEDALNDWADTGVRPEPLLAVLLGKSQMKPRARIVCACNGVTDAQIVDGIRNGMDLPALKQNLNCGTGCGSCVVQINQMINRYAGTEAL